MKYVLCFALFCFCYSFVVRKYKNPYKLYMVFGKKGSGKSSFLIRKAIEYQKKGYVVYTNMQDCCLENVRLINPDDLGSFVPCEDSCVLLDECGMLFDNRDYRNFKKDTRDFFILQRHYKVVVYLASQSFNVDKKLRDLVDSMYLISNVATAFALVRPIRKTITLTESTSEAESRIAENLKFQWIFSWKLFWIPRTIKYFKSFIAPDKPFLEFKFPEYPITYKSKFYARVHRVRARMKKNK